MYPEFGALGIQEGSSPALVREVGRQVALLPPYAITREELARRGLDLDSKEVYGIGKYAGAAALTYRRRLLERYRAGRLAAGPEGAGKRLGVFVDGGRTKIRTATRRQQGRGKHKTLRPRYRTDWREPKLLIVVELDEQGRMVPGSKPVLDGTFEGPDEVMELLAMYLHLLGAASAQLVSLGADGAAVGVGTLGLGQQTSGIESESGDQDLGLVSCRASPQFGLGTRGRGPRRAPPLVQEAAEVAEARGLVGSGAGVGETGQRCAGRPGGVDGVELPGATRRAGALGLCPLSPPWGALGQRCHRKRHSPGHQLAAQRQQHQLVRSECGRHAGVALSGAEQSLGRHLRPHQRQLGQRPSLGLDLPLPRHARAIASYFLEKPVRIWSSTASSQPARKRLPRRLSFTVVSFCKIDSASRRSMPRFSGL